MKFEVSKSKLYSQIMDAAVAFLGLDAETATEADVHNALEGATPLADQISKAATDAAAKFEEVNNRLTALEKEHAELKEQLTVKDARILELTTDAATATSEAKKQVETMKAQHKTEIQKLAGEISALKVGKTTEADEGGDKHPAESQGKETLPTTVTAVKSSALAEMAKKRQATN